MPEPQRMPPYALVMFATGAPAIGRREHVRLRDHVRRLVAAPRLALQPELLRVDVAALEQLLHAGHDRLDRARSRIAHLVDDVRLEHEVAVRHVVRRVDRRCGRSARRSCTGRPTDPRRSTRSSDTSSSGRSSRACRECPGAARRRRSSTSRAPRCPSCSPSAAGSRRRSS